MFYTLSDLTTIGRLIPQLKRIANTLFENLTQFEVKWPYSSYYGIDFVQDLLIEWVNFVGLYLTSEQAMEPFLIKDLWLHVTFNQGEVLTSSLPTSTHLWWNDDFLYDY